MQSLRAYRNPRRAISIEALLVWTFRAQRAELEPPRNREHARPAVGTEWIIFQRGAVLGCTIDCSGRVLPDRVHDDAETVAAVVAGALDWQMATRVAELARAGRHPACITGPVRCTARKPARPLAGHSTGAARQVSRRRVAPGHEGPQGPGTLRGLLNRSHLRPDAATGGRLAARLPRVVGRDPRGARAPARRPGAARPRAHRCDAAGGVVGDSRTTRARKWVDFFRGMVGKQPCDALRPAAERLGPALRFPEVSLARPRSAADRRHG